MSVYNRAEVGQNVENDTIAIGDANAEVSVEP